MKGIKRTKFNVCLLGNGHVGKTCLVSVYTGHEFDQNTLMTVGFDNYVDSAVFDGKEYRFKIFDTAGQERYRSISQSTIQISDGFFIVFSVDDKQSFDDISYWLNAIEENSDIKKKALTLVGNKVDLPNRKVTHEEAVNFAKDKNMDYYETSAKTGFGVKEIFHKLYDKIYRSYMQTDNNSNNNKEGNNDDDNNQVRITLDSKDLQNKKENKPKCCLQASA